MGEKGGTVAINGFTTPGRDPSAPWINTPNGVSGNKDAYFKSRFVPSR